MPAQPLFPPKNVEYWLGVALAVLSSETNATPVVTAPAEGIEFAVTGKSGDDVSPVTFTILLGPSAIPTPCVCVAPPPKQVENVMAGVAVLMIETKAIPFTSVEQELTTCAVVGKSVDVVVPTMYAFELESTVTPIARSPNKKAFPRPFVPPKYVEYTRVATPVAGAILISVRKALPFGFSSVVEIAFAVVGKFVESVSPVMYKFPLESTAMPFPSSWVSPPR